MIDDAFGLVFGRHEFAIFLTPAHLLRLRATMKGLRTPFNAVAGDMEFCGKCPSRCSSLCFFPLDNQFNVVGLTTHPI